jgi:asparagine N-glycosylation enzyme membrane subunit Stt3
VIGGAIFFVVVTGLLATTTHNYIPAIIFGVIFGAVFGLMFGSWPPGPGDEVTGGE